jgi:hypothetical protein
VCECVSVREKREREREREVKSFDWCRADQSSFEGRSRAQRICSAARQTGAALMYGRVCCGGCRGADENSHCECDGRASCMWLREATKGLELKQCTNDIGLATLCWNAGPLLTVIFLLQLLPMPVFGLGDECRVCGIVGPPVSSDVTAGSAANRGNIQSQTCMQIQVEDIPLYPNTRCLGGEHAVGDYQALCCAFAELCPRFASVLVVVPFLEKCVSGF